MLTLLPAVFLSVLCTCTTANFRVVTIEVGFVSVKTNAWTYVHTEGRKFKNPHVIMGLPNIGTSAINGGVQSCFRLKDVKFDDLNQYSFNVISRQPNDTWCNYTWWTPIHQPAQYVAWMVVEEGHFVISGGEFDVRNRDLWGHCSYFFIRHSWFGRFYDGSVRPCVIATVQSYNDHRFISFRQEMINVNANGVSI